MLAKFEDEAEIYKAIPQHKEWYDMVKEITEMENDLSGPTAKEGEKFARKEGLKRLVIFLIENPHF